MKTTKIVTLLMSVGVIALTTAVTSVEAEERPTQTTTSKATVQFEANQDNPTLINPDNPQDSPGEETGAEAGPLSLDYVPSINFDKKIISATQKDYVAVRKEGDSSPFVQVTDNRGTGAGWNLTASLSEFAFIDETTGETTHEKLKGAHITLLDGEIVTNGSQSNEPQNGSELLEDRNKEGIELTSEKTMIMKAEYDEGMGSWAMVWKDSNMDTLDVENILLTVPGGIAKKGNYTAEIEWTLENTPGPTEG